MHRLDTAAQLLRYLQQILDTQVARFRQRGSVYSGVRCRNLGRHGASHPLHFNCTAASSLCRLRVTIGQTVSIFLLTIRRLPRASGRDARKTCRSAFTVLAWNGRFTLALLQAALKRPQVKPFKAKLNAYPFNHDAQASEISILVSHIINVHNELRLKRTRFPGSEVSVLASTYHS